MSPITHLQLTLDFIICLHSTGEGQEASSNEDQFFQRLIMLIDTTPILYFSSDCYYKYTPTLARSVLSVVLRRG